MADRELYAFAGFVLDVAERRLDEDGREVSLPPKVFDLLVALVRRAGHLVTKQELLDLVWSGACVEEGNLSVQISAVRKALHDTARPPRYIQTVSRSGYRFVADVVEPGTARPVARERWSLAVLPARPLNGAAGAAGPRPQLYELCARGRLHLLSASMAEVPDAVEAFRTAAQLDPSYAPAHAGLALACCAQAAMRLAVHAPRSL